jgi:hypothetical protein
MAGALLVRMVKHPDQTLRVVSKFDALHDAHMVLAYSWLDTGKKND